ncbi:MAG: hypothetical protein L6R38_006127 [Xanthoria sp. 2 TBL-2021]|nr:MAG: hypothetical protein L6R38_006127 [Xanthoria sp. 2 TBL-2021]
MDARITQKAFIHWYSNVFLPSDRGRGLSRNARREVHILISEEPPNPIDRSGLWPETLEVISIWENEPIPVASAKWRVARVRLIADLLLNDMFLELQDHHTLAAATPDEVNEARCWIYQQSDGEFVRYQPLAQPWCTKEIPWPYDDTQIRLADQSRALKSLPSAWIIDNMDDVRISTEKFNDLVGNNNGGFRPGDYHGEGSYADDYPDSESDHERGGRFEGNVQDDLQGTGRIRDWLELAMHSTCGCADEGWLDRDVNELVTPDIEFDPKGIEGLREIECCSSAYTTPPPPPPTSSWTAINGPLNE